MEQSELLMKILDRSHVISMEFLSLRCRCLHFKMSILAWSRGDGCFHRLTNIGWISWPWCEFHKHFQPNENSPAIKKSPATQNDGNGCPFLHAAIIAKMKATRWNRRPKTINAITTPFQSENKMALLQVF